MEPFTRRTGTGMPLRRTNVDTDQIIPARFLKRVSRTGFGDGLFAGWREDPDFVLNDERYRGAGILVAGTEFGTGSSREHAVWALQDYGFVAVIAPRFGDIFAGNALKRGLLPVELEPQRVEWLWATIESNPKTEITIDVEHRIIQVAQQEWKFPINDHNRWRLIEGLDDIDMTLRQESQITGYEEKRPQWLPVTLPVRN